MRRVVVGVDAGGTKTAVAHRIDGAPPHVVTGEGASATTLGAERAAAHIGDLIERSLDGAKPHAIFVGIAGGGTASVANAVREALASRFTPCEIAVRDDASIALRAAIPNGDGIVIIAGTGSIAYAERDGESYRCGGYGYLIGDEGSGFAIGASAIRHLLRAYDGRTPKDALAARIEEMLGVTNAQQIVEQIYGQDRKVGAIAQAAAVVLEAAGEGDRSATKIAQNAALDLGELTKAVVKKAGLRDSSAPIALAGGLLAQNSILTYLLETRLLNEFASMPILKSSQPPYEGALVLAEALLQ